MISKFAPVVAIMRSAVYEMAIAAAKLATVAVFIAKYELAYIFREYLFYAFVV